MVSAGADISALVPAVTKGVVDTLTSMGVIRQGKEQPETTTSQGSSTCDNVSVVHTLYVTYLSKKHKDKTTDIGKWLTMFFGLPFLPSNEVEDCFVKYVMSVAPTDSKCHSFRTTFSKPTFHQQQNSVLRCGLLFLVLS